MPLATIGLDHVALVLGPVEVAVGQLLAFPDEPQGLLAGDRDLALGVVVAVGGERVVVDDGDPAQVLGEGDEALEVDQDDVVHPGAGQLLQGPHGERNATEGVRGVDLVLAVAGDLDVHVPGEGHDVGLVPLLVQVHDHDRVAAAGARVIRIAAVRSEQHVVQGAGLLRLLGRPGLARCGGRVVAGQVDAAGQVRRHAAVDAEQVDRARAERDDQEDGDRDQDPGPDPTPRARASARVRQQGERPGSWSGS